MGEHRMTIPCRRRHICKQTVSYDIRIEIMIMEVSSSGAQWIQSWKRSAEMQWSSSRQQSVSPIVLESVSVLLAYLDAEQLIDVVGVQVSHPACFAVS